MNQEERLRHLEEKVKALSERIRKLEAQLGAYRHPISYQNRPPARIVGSPLPKEGIVIPSIIEED